MLHILHKKRIFGKAITITSGRPARKSGIVFTSQTGRSPLAVCGESGYAFTPQQA
jgi:hypothetical protein